MRRLVSLCVCCCLLLACALPCLARSGDVVAGIIGVPGKEVRTWKYVFVKASKPPYYSIEPEGFFALPCRFEDCSEHCNEGNYARAQSLRFDTDSRQYVLYIRPEIRSGRGFPVKDFDLVGYFTSGTRVFNRRVLKDLGKDGRFVGRTIQSSTMPVVATAGGIVTFTAKAGLFSQAQCRTNSVSSHTRTNNGRYVEFAPGSGRAPVYRGWGVLGVADTAAARDFMAGVLDDVMH